LRLEGGSQVGIIPICVSSEEKNILMPCCTIVAGPPTSACASRQAPLRELFQSFM
jgi:hypothetical protein